MTTNKQWRVRRHPQPDEIIAEEHFELSAQPVPDIGNGEFLVRSLVFGTSPAQRGYIDARKPDTVGVGEVMRGRGIGVVEKSRHPDYQPGDWVNASMGWQEWSVHGAKRGPVQTMDVLSVQKVDHTLRPSSLHLGTLGSAAFAAYYGLHDIGGAKVDKTVVISAAAGGVGSMACQIARQLGCHVVGIAGGAQKCQWLTEVVGCHSAIDYKSGKLDEALQASCPDGIDVFFDNVGGNVLNTTLPHLAMHAAVVVCGYISTEYERASASGPNNYTFLLKRRARMEGFVIWDHVARFPEFFAALRDWYEAGKISREVEEVVHGIEALPNSLRSLFTGANRGIRLVQAGKDPEEEE